MMHWAHKINSHNREVCIINFVSIILIILVIIASVAFEFHMVHATDDRAASFTSMKQVPEVMLDTINFSAYDVFSQQLKISTDTSTLIGTMVFSNDGAFALTMHAMQVGAAVWLVVNALFQYISETDNEDEDEGLLAAKTVYRIAIGMFFITLADSIAKGIAVLGLSTIAVVLSNSAPVKETVNTITMETLCGVKNPDNELAISVALMLNFPWCLSLITKIIAYTTAFSIVIEAGIRRILMPFTIAGIAAEGRRSSSMRGLKHYFGLFARIAVIMAVLTMTAALKVPEPAPPDATTHFVNIISFLVLSTCINIIGVTMALRSEVFVNELLRR